MGKDSSIAWTDHTFQPWTRCTKVSPACDHCYAETWANRATHPKASDGRALPVWGNDAPRAPTSAHNWKQPIRWNREAETAGERRRVFCASLADVFEDHPAITASGARERLWDLIESTPHLDWLLLTKRPENMTRFAPSSWAKAWPRNVWAGTTAEDQTRANQRVPRLLRVPAVVRFLSVEPMLEAIELARFLAIPSDHGLEDDPLALHLLHECIRKGIADGPRAIHWVICGGESGHHARPFNVTWARSIVKQCGDAGIAPFVEQLGAHVIWDGVYVPGEHWPKGTLAGERTDVGYGHGWRVRLKDKAGADPEEWPEDLRVQEFPTVSA